MKSSVFTPILFALLASLLLALSAFGQSKEGELRKKKKELQRDIEFKEELLKETTKNKQVTMTNLLIYRRQISQRQELIQTIGSQVTALDRKIVMNQDLIQAMENDLQELREQYAQMIYHAWRNRSTYDRMMFVFASRDFNQAYKRLKYFQQYSEYRQKQAVLIEKTRQAINDRLTELEQKKREKQDLLGQEHNEKQSLAQAQRKEQEMYSSLKSKESQLVDDIKKKRSEADKLEKAIKEEIRKAMLAAKNEKLTPEAQKLSRDFTANKGSLPWPLDRGEITGRFGEHPHPVLPQIKIKNNGIDFGTTKGSNARAVFAGEVTGVVSIAGAGKAIFVRHGEYLTVYSNIEEAFVKKGDNVKTKEVIGSIAVDDASGKTSVHFEIWKDKTVLDPHLWLYKAN